MAGMSENTQDNELEAPASSGANPTSAKTTGFNLGLAVAIVALVLVGLLWLDSRQHGSSLEKDMGRRLAEFDSRNKESQLVATRAQEESRQAMAKLSLVEQKLADSQNQQLALEALYQELAHNRDEWVLAEIEQILLIASEQLQLAGNLKAALIALQTADGRLQRLDKPQFIALRKAIVTDIERLQALPAVDVVGYSLRLDGLAGMVDGLPLVVGSELPADKVALKARADDQLLAKLGREIWQDMKQLVRIQNMENPEAPLLTPSQSYFLRENLRLRLLSARIALQRHDELTYKADLKAAETWVRRYFDVKAKPTQAALGILKQLSSGSLHIEMPNISSSLNAVRGNKLVRERSALK